jgi:CelD/BcsL family acetyltransferase involved in cellulose biosynthesis
LIRMLRPSDGEWDRVIGAASHDFYHLAGYHAVAEARGEGQACLLVYQEGDQTIALPLLLRPTAEMAGLEGTSSWDATSVYGYPGPVVSRAGISEGVAERFRRSLEPRLRQMDVVSVFSRLHPLLPQRAILRGLGRIEYLGPTASIDLSLPLEEQRRAMSANHRNQINKLRRSDLVCVDDDDWQFIDHFIEIYHETMRRVEARPYYLFDRDFFLSLREALQDRLRLVVVRLGAETVCGGLFVLTDRILQYYLGGTRNAYLRLAPIKLLFDAVRCWGCATGAARFHLGGGLGAKEDSLYEFKRRFATDTHDFHVWKWIVDDQRYAELCALRQRPDDRATAPAGGFFPAYRS